MTSSPALEELIRWYEKNCDGDWEHQNGFELMTVDNPGLLFRFFLFSATHSIDKSIENKRLPINADPGDELMSFWWEPEKSELRLFATTEYLQTALEIVLERLQSD